MHFRVFLKVNVQNGGYFWRVAKISNIFWVLEIPDIYIYIFFFFLGGGVVNGRCWARTSYEEKNESTPPPPPPGVWNVALCDNGSVTPWYHIPHRCYIHFSN